ncbi:MAG: carboxylesterase family protein [Bacteroidetes bacterium]|nr:carboxylesterase family protein [Bacteroidota bacterium]
MVNKKFRYAACVAIIVSLFFYSFKKKFREGTIDTVSIESGMISGVKSEASDIVSFKGIPFAAPPVGDMRWKAPAPPASWKGIKKCDAFGPSPMQPKPIAFFMLSKEFLIPEQPMSEDCLYLNVWTGARSAKEKRPVFVWIYGGGFTTGGASVPAYDGEAMAKKGLVFVSFNYRLGIFGFYAHPELTKESPQHASGNYGLLDQIAVLQWIKKNISAFGGDPGNVTIAGQSAGSISVNCLMASPLAKGLFHRAIAESGNMVVPNPFIKMPLLSRAEEDGVKWASSKQIQSLAELRKAPAKDLTQIGMMMGMYGPVADGYVLPEPIPDIYAHAKQNHTPFLSGWNADEGIVVVYNDKEAFKKQALRFGPDSASFFKYYPASTDEEAKSSQMSLSRDLMTGISGYKWAELESSSNSDVYLYYFTRKPPTADNKPKYGAFHTAEIGYALDNLKLIDRPWQPVDDSLAVIISSYWANFAKTGNPNGNGLPQWPKYDSKKNMTMVLSEKPQAERLPNKDALDFLYSKMSGQ